METLKTSSLSSVANGLLAVSIDDALAKIHEDLNDRPDLSKPRTVTITLAFAPSKGERALDNGVPVDRATDLEAARIEFSVAHKLPAAKFTRKMQNVSGRNAFGFETDTNSIKHHPDQQAMKFQDDDGDNEE
jgi:hypothetical protein